MTLLPKTTIVFVHHFGGSARTAGPVIDRLDPQVDALTFDLPGFGNAAGAVGPYNVEAQADFVQSQIRAASCERFVLVGHSMGGKIALALAAQQPAGLAALVLVAPSPPTPEPIDVAERARLIAGWGDDSVMSQSLDAIIANPIADDLRRLALADMLRANKAAWTAWLEHGSREDISARMSRIDVPTTILSGGRDTILPTKLHRKTAGMLVNARLVEVAGAGHLLPIEASDAVAKAITSLTSRFAAARPQVVARDPRSIALG